MTRGTRWPIFWILLAVGFTALAVAAVSTGRPYGVIPALIAWAEVWRSRPNRPVRDRYGNWDIEALGAAAQRMTDGLDKEVAEARRVLDAAPDPERQDWYAAWDTMRQPEPENPDLAEKQRVLWYTYWKTDSASTGESAVQWLQRRKDEDQGSGGWR